MQRNKTKGVANLPVQVHRPTTEIISAVADRSTTRNFRVCRLFVVSGLEITACENAAAFTNTEGLQLSSKGKEWQESESVTFSLV